MTSMVESTPFNMRIISGAINYLNEVKLEMFKVTWPSREQTFRMVILVILVGMATGAFLGGLDFLFSRIIGAILSR